MAYNVARQMREHLYSVYIMWSLSGVLYIGVTSDLQARFASTRQRSSKGFLRNIDVIA